LFVFVPPWNTARVPAGWSSAFEAHGAIFISAAKSGNDQSVLARRIPLALLAEQNVEHHYPIDAEHIYIGGFSGGSRVSLRIALAYPDIFRGVILNAGSDPIGTRYTTPPPKDLMRQFQDGTRLIFVTGEEDLYNHQMDFASRRSLDDWCVFHVSTVPMPSVAHEPASANLISRAFEALESPLMKSDDPGKLQACRLRIENQIEDELHKAQLLTAEGERDQAANLLRDIDQRYGGLAASGTLELFSELSSK